MFGPQFPYLCNGAGACAEWITRRALGSESGGVRAWRGRGPGAPEPAWRQRARAQGAARPRGGEGRERAPARAGGSGTERTGVRPWRRRLVWDAALRPSGRRSAHFSSRRQPSSPRAGEWPGPGPGWIGPTRAGEGAGAGPRAVTHTRPRGRVPARAPGVRGGKWRCVCVRSVRV